jgi:hypothetical protein
MAKRLGSDSLTNSAVFPPRRVGASQASFLCRATGCFWPSNSTFRRSLATDKPPIISHFDMELVLIILVAAHLLAVNLAGAGPLVAAWIDWRGARCGEAEAATAARTLMFWSIGAAVFGMCVGGAALAVFVYRPPHTHQRYWRSAELEITETRWWFLGAEIAFYYVCTIAAAVIWRRADRRVWVRRILAIAAGTNLLYHFPALFTILAIMFERRDHRGWPLDRQLYWYFLLQAETIARILHVWMSSLAVAGLSLCWIGARPSAADPAASRRVAVNGAWISLAATLLQIPIGVWLLTVLPEDRTQRILSSAPIFWPAIFVALLLMHQLAMLSIGDLSRRRISTATLLLMIVVLLMTATLYSSRPL